MVTAALAPTLWRERRRVTVTDVGLAAIFPAIGIAAGIFASEVLHDRTPIAGHVWPAFAATPCPGRLLPRVRPPPLPPRPAAHLPAPLERARRRGDERRSRT